MTTVQERPNGPRPQKRDPQDALFADKLFADKEVSPPLKSDISDLEFTAAPVSPGAQPDHPTSSSGESHQQDELSPVNRVIPSEQRERGTSPNDSSSRCQFTFSDGRRCRNHSAQLCVHHGSKQRHPSPESTAPDAPEPPIRSGSASRATNESEGSLGSLEPLCSDLTNATNINRALTQVFLLMAQGRISQKQAVAFGYISQLLLQTLPGVRAEFVSVYDPNSWRARLQASLECIEDHGCDESDYEHDRPTPSRLVQNKSVHPTSVVIPSEDSERGIPLKPFTAEEKPDSAPIPMNESDVNELEEPEPTESMPPSVRVAEVITLLPRTSPPQQSSSRTAETAAPPPLPTPAKRVARDFYGNPIPPAGWWCSLPGANAAIQRAPQPVTGKADLSLPRSDITPAGFSSASDRLIPADAKNSTPVATPPSQFITRNPLERNRHTTAWFAPASWSGRQKPDPYPSGAGKRRHRFSSLANSAFRRILHQNSRGFWSPGTKRLAT